MSITFLRLRVFSSVTSHFLTFCIHADFRLYQQVI
jgi:hypothetical protein